MLQTPCGVKLSSFLIASPARASNNSGDVWFSCSYAHIVLAIDCGPKLSTFLIASAAIASKRAGEE